MHQPSAHHALHLDDWGRFTFGDKELLDLFDERFLEGVSRSSDQAKTNEMEGNEGEWRRVKRREEE